MKLTAVTCCLAVLILPACGKKIDHQIQDAVRKFDSAGLDRKEVEILTIQESGGVALVEVKVKTALKLRKGKTGEWLIEEVRLGDGHWEKGEHILRVLEQERTRTTAERLDSVTDGIRRYQERHGQVPEADSFEALIDLLVPGCMERVMRLDGWSRSFQYRYDSQNQYDLRSSGPDGVFMTGDDLIARSQ